MARKLPFALATLFSLLALGSPANAADEPKKEEPKKEEAKEEPKAEETPAPAGGESKAEHPSEKPKTNAGDEENKYDWRKEAGGEHGSQVASSEWLPISIGAAIGVMGGALAGVAWDDSKPPIWGPLVGGIAGGFAGGAGGAWLIRTQRDKDTRTAGMITGLAIGVGFGAMLYSQMDDNDTLEAVGKYGALAVAPLLGAVAGRALAAHFYLRPAKDETPAPKAIIPTVSPVMTASHGATGMTFNIDAVF